VSTRTKLRSESSQARHFAPDTDFYVKLIDVYPDSEDYPNDSEWRPARNTIHHDAERASAIVLPIWPMSNARHDSAD